MFPTSFKLSLFRLD